MDFMKKKMKAEADKRIRILEEMNVWDEVSDFWKEGTVCFTKTAVIPLFSKTEEVGVTFTFEEDIRLKKIKEQYESNTGCLVYYGIDTKTDTGEILSLLFVSSDESQWETERGNLRKGYPTAYSYHVASGLEEIGTIRTKMARGGGLIRIL